MIKIELVKFEAQDVITASVAAPACVHTRGPIVIVEGGKNGKATTTCTKCGASGSFSFDTYIVSGQNYNITWGK